LAAIFIYQTFVPHSKEL